MRRLSVEVDGVLNVAGATNWAGDRRRLNAVNVIGATRGYQLAKALGEAAGTRKLYCYASSIHAAGGAQGSLPEFPFGRHENRTAYELKKWLGETTLLERAARDDGDGPALCIARIGGLVGNSSTGATSRRNSLYMLADRLEDLPLGRARSAAAAASTCCTATSASLLLDALLRLHAEPPEKPEIIHVCAGESAPLTEAVFRALDSVDHAHRRRRPRTFRIPTGALLATSEQLRRYHDVPRKWNNLLIGLRYLSLDRIFERSRLAALWSSRCPRSRSRTWCARRSRSRARRGGGRRRHLAGEVCGMRALVIGGTGFVGSAVVRAFDSRGIDVVTVSRSGLAFAGEGVRGDVRAHNLGMDKAAAEDLMGSVPHIVSTFGSVDWGAGPRRHRAPPAGNPRRHALRRAVRPAREVRAPVVRARPRAPHRGAVVDGSSSGSRSAAGTSTASSSPSARCGPTTGSRGAPCASGPSSAPARTSSPAHGIMAVVPLLLRGYPMHLKDHGRFPCYPTDVKVAGEVLARAALDDGAGEVWTYFDDANPSLAEVLIRLCSPWGVVPRIVDLPILNPISRLLAERLGTPRETLEYIEPWPDIPVEVLNLLPADLPRCPPGYIEATGKAPMRSTAR